MRTYRTPGVYFERQDAAASLIGPLRTDIAGFVGVAERGPLHKGVKIESLTQFMNVFGGKIAQGYLAYAVEGFFKNKGQTCWVVRVADPATARVASLDISDDAGTHILRITAGSPGSWGNRILVRWLIRGDQILSLTLHFPDGTEQLERDPLRFSQTEGPEGQALEPDALPASRLTPLVTIERSTPKKRLSPAQAQAVAPIRALQGWLVGGSDGLAGIKPEHFSGEGTPFDKPWGLAALEQVKEVSVVAMPDIMPKLPVSADEKPPLFDCTSLDVQQPETFKQPEAEFPPAFGSEQILILQQAMIMHCERLRYRVAILDMPNGSLPSNPLLPEAAAKWGRGLGSSSFAALYYPWIMVDDPLLLTGLVRIIPPSGHLAGIYARSDFARGVHKPPANDMIEGAVDLSFTVDDILHGFLNDNRVNALRPFAGRGLRVYGARTLSTDLRFVNVRRLLSMIEKAIDQGTQWTVFEPNNDLLRREMDRVVRSYLQTLFRKGMLDGATPEEAYFVKCDESINPPEQIDTGRVVCQVGVQPPYPAEFVVVVIGKTLDAMEVLQEQGVGQNG
ncbi:MAG TPA: phage tail sheath C-terminal domain-containing protein [Blastocatellia bacterium]|nr:phage tail sheath C-terminal domain-containing protein [Blastocatellia bacterium]